VEEDPDRPGLYKIVFKPRGPGTYRIFIIYNRRLVKGTHYKTVNIDIIFIIYNRRLVKGTHYKTVNIDIIFIIYNRRLVKGTHYKTVNIDIMY